MKRNHLRLAAGTLALALPLAGAAACGADKKKTVKQEFASAQARLSDSKAASFTLRLDDSKGALAALATKDGDLPGGVAAALFKGSVTYVTDPAGDATLKAAAGGCYSGTQLDDQLKKVNAAFVIRDDRAVLAELRAVAGDLYLKVDLTEAGRLAELTGVDDFDAQLDAAVADMGPEFKGLVADARAGKFLKLPLSKYLPQLKELSGLIAPSTAPSTDCEGVQQLGTDLLAAVKPHVTVTDANNDSDHRVLDVRIKARPAVKAALRVLQTSTAFPFLGQALGSDAQADVDKHVADEELRGTITLEKGHLTQFAVDLESIRLLDPEEKAGVNSVAGSKVVVDVDDSADEVAVPGNVSSFDVGALVEQFMQAFTGAAGGSAMGFGMEGSYAG